MIGSLQAAGHVSKEASRRVGPWTSAVLTLLSLSVVLHSAEAQDKPVIVYSRYFNAEGESRYLPDGTYAEVLKKLRTQFDVRVHSQPLTNQTLADVQVILIANPSDQAVDENPPPHHFSAPDVQALTKFVENGGGLIVMGNQENHNLEIEATNQLLSQFGLRFVNEYTDIKSIRLPDRVPVIGGLHWAYYTGNRVALQSDHPAQPRSLVDNDVTVQPLNGERNQKGSLLAVSQPGSGRVVVVTDAGWITNAVLSGEGIGGVTIDGHDNWEIFRRLALWAARRNVP